MWDRIALDEKDVREGIEAGSLIADVRLRDAFRRIREPARVSETPAGRDVLGADLIGSAVFSEAELVRLQRWLDDVHRRVTVAEGRE